MAKLAQQPAPVADEEQSFPRGGASTITPLKRRQIRAEAQADAERDFFAGASAGAQAGNKRRKKGSHDAGAHSAEHTFLAGSKVPAFVELLKFKSCSVGAKIWGVISDVMHHGLIISLPDGLKGYVSAAEASDVLSGLKTKSERPPALTELFQAGQLVRGTILSLETQPKAGASNSKSGKKTINISLT
ncbi:MAG: RRP5 protein, partial [Trebouxia sp. A1-2]